VMSSGQVLVSQPLYGRLGNAVGQSLVAPVGTGAFAFQERFMTKDGVDYNPAHFDEGDKVLAPEPVDNNTPNTLGWYYSDNNTLEKFVDKTGYPYSRSYVHPVSGTSLASQPGDQHRMGGGKESKSYTTPILNELDHYMSLRNYFTPNTATTLQLQGMKSLSVDVNGIERLTFMDKEGKVLASCLSGSQYPAMTLLGSIGAGSMLFPKYLDIYIPNTGSNVAITIANPERGRVQVTNLASGSVYASTPTSLPTGFYRIESIIGGQTISYQVNYGDFSYNYYDDAGRLVASVAPKGVVFTSTNYPDFTTRYQYNTRGQLLQEGDAQFIYRQDGSLRFSQNAQQRADRRFAYTNYDRLGRKVEVGVYQMP
jgi:hypothetical protein